jgi:proton-dependent oligopeptide transporter, POT family
MPKRDRMLLSLNPLREHPPGVAILALTEVWERMSYYGMQALLVYYMTRHLAFTQSQASLIYGVYTGAVWLAPLPGGAIADRWLGQHKSVLIGGVLMALGHFLLTFDSVFYPALAAIAIGNGLFKPNISTQVGDLYPPDDPRRDRGYSVYYFGVSVGAFIAPLVCGTVGELYGWHWGFGLAGIGMLAGLATYVFARRLLPPDRIGRGSEKSFLREEAVDTVWSKSLALGAIALSAAFFWTAYQQQGNTLALWALDFTNRHITAGGFDFTIPATWFQSLNGLFIIALTPALVSLWRYQAGKGREPSSDRKLVIGAVIGSLAFLVMVIAAVLEARAGPVSWVWLVIYFLMITLGELYLSPTCLSLFNRAAPVRLASTMVGVWYLSLFLGSFLAGVVGSYWSDFAKPTFFAAMSVLTLLSALAFYASTRGFGKVLFARATSEAGAQIGGASASSEFSV